MMMPLSMEANTLLFIMAAGVVVCLVIPILVGLKIFVMNETFNNFKLEVERDFVRKDVMTELKQGIDKKFDHLDTKLDGLYDKLDDFHKELRKK
jgi:uncharacterized protein YlxW (UPF0749 family)